jgi:hypothetical protein
MEKNSKDWEGSRPYNEAIIHCLRKPASNKYKGPALGLEPGF